MAGGYDQTILEAVLAACEGIREDAGYLQTVSRAQLWDPAEAQRAERPLIEIRDGELQRNLSTGGTGSWLVTQAIEIDGLIAPIEHEDKTLGNALRDMREDLFNALLVAFDPFGASPLQATLTSMIFTFLHDESEDEVLDGVRCRAIFSYAHDITDESQPIPP